MASDRTRELANQIAQIPVELNGIKWSSKARVTTLKHDHEKIVALLDAFESEILLDFKKIVEDAHSAGEVMDWLQGREAELAAQPTPEVKK